MELLTEQFERYADGIGMISAVPSSGRPSRHGPKPNWPKRVASLNRGPTPCG